MKRITTIVLALIIAGAAQAQEYKIAKSTGRLEIRDVNNVTLEGYSGNEIVFSSLDNFRDRDARSSGLRAISAGGLEDNTGIGLSVRENGSTFVVNQLKKMDGPRVKILVPKGVSVLYSHTSPHGSDLKVRNLESELEVSTVHNSVRIDNASGPLNIRTVHGQIEADLPATVKGPLNFTSTHGLVDIAITTAVKANVMLSAGHGEIFVDPTLNLEIPKTGEWARYGSSRVEGKLGGGGLDLSLSTSFGNVYLRKK